MYKTQTASAGRHRTAVPAQWRGPRHESFPVGERASHDLAVPTSVGVRDAAEARRFYTEMLGFAEFRCGEDRLQFQVGDTCLDCRLDPELADRGGVITRYVFANGAYRPSPHFSARLSWHDWEALVRRLRSHGLPCTLASGQSSSDARGAATASVVDPSGNLIELKQEGHSRQALAKIRATRLAVCLSGAALIAMAAYWSVRHASIVMQDVASELGARTAAEVFAHTCGNAAFCAH